MKRYAASDLKEVVVHFVPSAATDSDFQETQTLSGGVTMRGKWTQKAGREYMRSEQVESEAVGVLVLRYRSTITANSVFQFRNTTWEVVGEPADVDGLKTWLEIPLKDSDKDYTIE